MYSDRSHLSSNSDRLKPRFPGANVGVKRYPSRMISICMRNDFNHWAKGENVLFFDLNCAEIVHEE